MLRYLVLFFLCSTISADAACVMDGKTYQAGESAIIGVSRAHGVCQTNGTFRIGGPANRSQNGRANTSPSNQGNVLRAGKSTTMRSTDESPNLLNRQSFCNSFELWKNMKWCLTPAGKDGKQQRGIATIRASGENGNKWQTALGYALCQHHQFHHAVINRIIGGVGADFIIQAFRGGRGGPIRNAEYCGVDELHKQAMHVMRCQDHNGARRNPC